MKSKAKAMTVRLPRYIVAAFFVFLSLSNIVSSDEQNLRRTES